MANFEIMFHNLSFIIYNAVLVYLKEKCYPNTVTGLTLFQFALAEYTQYQANKRN